MIARGDAGLVVVFSFQFPEPTNHTRQPTTIIIIILLLEPVKPNKTMNLCIFGLLNLWRERGAKSFSEDSDFGFSV
jgi:hypothetical protein